MARPKGRQGITCQLADVARKKAQALQGRRVPGKQLDPVLRMTYAFEQVYGEYIYKPDYYFGKSTYTSCAGMPPRSREAFERAVKKADIAKADYVDWVRAHFYWVHILYGRSCKIWELATKHSITRYQEWKKLVDKGEISGKVTSIVLPATEIEETKVDQINKERLRRLMKAYDKTEAEIITAFANENIFDPEWLAEHPVIQTAKG